MEQNDNSDKETNNLVGHSDNIIEESEEKHSDNVEENESNNHGDNVGETEVNNHCDNVEEQNDNIVEQINNLDEEKETTIEKQTNNVVEQTNNVVEQTNNIIDNLQLLDRNISKIKKKIAKVNKLYLHLEQNKILVINPSSNYLKFQLAVLKNECSYYKNLYTLILNKYTTEIYELSDYIYMILLSLNKLEIEKDEDKTNICNKIIHIKKTSNISYGKLNEIINSTINNLKLINEYVKLFDSYINKTVSNNNIENVHNNTYEISIKNKKDSIILEYKKFYNKFLKIVSYFKECSECTIQQIDTSKLLKFFLKSKSI